MVLRGKKSCIRLVAPEELINTGLRVVHGNRLREDCCLIGCLDSCLSVDISCFLWHISWRLLGSLLGGVSGFYCVFTSSSCETLIFGANFFVGAGVRLLVSSPRQPSIRVKLH